MANYFGVLQPRMVRFALDEVVATASVHPLLNGFGLQGDFREGMGRQLLWFGGLVLTFALTMGVFMFFMRWTLIVMSRLIEYDLRKEVYDHYQRLDSAFYKRNSTGDLMSRITEDISKVRMYLGPAVLYSINLVFLFVLVIQAMIRVDPKLTMYSLLPLPVLSLSIYYVSELINRKSARIQGQLSALTAIAQEVYSGIRVIKSYVRERSMIAHFAGESDRYKTLSMDLARTDALFMPFIVLMIGVSTIITVYIGGLRVFDGSITAGNIGEFVIYVNMLTWPVTSIGWVASIIQQAEASQQRINEFMAARPALENGVRDLEGDIIEVRFRNVGFVYPDTGIEAVKDFDLEIHQGQKLAIVGRTGSGKTTIAELLLRMYDPTSGGIEVNGVDIRQWSVKSLRAAMAYVPQDVFLFSDTVFGNIAFGRQEAERSRVEQVARLAVVDEEIRRLPSGYETLVGERGVTLSGGQKQRISLARALLRDSSLLVLDDCLAAVDNDTEKQILGHMDGSAQERTVILITHRITGLAAFDQVLVMEEGSIVERGTHDELLAKGGFYAEMFAQQTMEAKSV